MSTLFRLFLSFNFLNYHLCQRIPSCFSTLSTLYYLKQFSKWSSHFAFPFYKRCIILNSLVNGRASYKCIYHMNSEVKVFAKLFSKSGYKGKPSRAGLPLCLRHSPLAERFQGKAFRRLRTSGRDSVPCTLQAFKKA